MRSESTRVHMVAAAVVVVVGCSARPTQSDGDGSAGSTSDATGTGGTSSTEPPSGTTIIGTTGQDSSGGGADTSSGGSDDGMSTAGFLCVSGDDQLAHCSSDGGGVTFECDMFAQDCPQGEKCSAWSNDGGPLWNATRCAPVDPAPDEVGEACTVEGSGVSGIDSCAPGAMCWHVSAATNVGQCVALCRGDEVDPTCPDQTMCRLSNDGALILCVPPCDPLVPSCGDGQVCAPYFGGTWSCVPTISTPVAAGQPGELDNVCESGTVCVGAPTSPSCEGALGCCAQLCDLAAPSCDDPAAQCVSWYAAGERPPGFESTGVCTAGVEMPEDGWRLDEPWLTWERP